jgi:hypothetical protein
MSIWYSSSIHVRCSMSMNEEASELSQYSVWLQTDDPEAKNFPLTSVSRPAETHPIQWVQRVLSLWVKGGRGMTLKTHLHLVSRSTISKSYASSPPWHPHGIVGQLYFTLHWSFAFHDFVHNNSGLHRTFYAMRTWVYMPFQGCEKGKQKELDLDHTIHLKYESLIIYFLKSIGNFIWFAC